MKFNYTLPDLRKMKKYPLRRRNDALKCGVYAIFYKEQIVYIGQSTNIYRRLNEHIKEFSGVLVNYNFYELPNSDNFATYRQIRQELNIIEDIYIRWYNPIKNRLWEGVRYKQ